MANRRMFSLSVIDTDKFLDMPVSSQLLYFHLGMRADDDGFVSSPKRIARTTNCGDDDLRILATKGYIIPFESGVVVIRHWRQNNQLRSDRYRETVCKNEQATLSIIDNIYIESTNEAPDSIPVGIPNDIPASVPTGKPTVDSMVDSTTYHREPQYSIGKYSIDKSSIDKEIYVQPEVATPPELTPKKKTSRFLPPTEEEVKQYCLENGYTLDAQRFVDFYECKGWMVGKNKMKNWKAAVRTWARKDQGGVRDEPEPTNSIRLW